MPAAREDYLMRLLQQVNAALRRLRERLLARKGDGSPEDAQDLAAVERESGQSITMLLGPQAMLLQAIDPASAVALLDADRVALWVALLETQAAAARARGEEARATPLESRAAALAGAATARWPDWQRLA